MPLSSKLCFIGVDHARALRSDTGSGKQSFQDMCVTKLELGHEESIARASPYSSSTTHVSFDPPPCDEFTTSEPLRRATRVRPPGMMVVFSPLKT